MSLKFLCIYLGILLVLEPVKCLANLEDTGSLDSIRQSFDSINIEVPIYYDKSFGDVLVVRNQEEWNNLSKRIKERIDGGCKTLLVSVEAKVLRYGEKPFKLEHFHYRDVSIKVVAKRTLMIPEGQSFSKKDFSRNDFSHWVMPCHQFRLNNMVFDNRHKNLTFLDDVFAVNSEIEDVAEYGEDEILSQDGSLYRKITKIWRFKTDLPNLNERDCKDFYILLTRKWTSCRHRVLKVENGYLYFFLKSDDAESLYQMCMDPNSDYKSYRTRPRCRYINRPFRKGIYISNDSVYVPMEIRGLVVSGGYQFLVVSDCYLKSLDIQGFRVLGATGYSSIYVHNSRFVDKLWIQENEFTYLAASAINIENSENICIYNNKISKTRANAIRCLGRKITIWKNTLKDIGYMLQSVSISFSGTDIHVFDNDVQNFYYSAIGMGNTSSNEANVQLSYIVERNKIHYSPTFNAHYIKHSLADGGGIYVGPQNTRGIIRYNVIECMRGIGDNRGIFLDDGAKNLAIYGNMIMNTANSYDIDLRQCDTYAKGIPDHNTNNQIFHNIMTGGYRFQDTGKDDSCCFGGENLLLCIGDFQKKVVELKYSVPDYTLEGCKYKKGKVIIPKHYRALLDSLRIDSFVRKHISL